jgi:hypothetical protein
VLKSTCIAAAYISFSFVRLFAVHNTLCTLQPEGLRAMEAVVGGAGARPRPRVTIVGTTPDIPTKWMNNHAEGQHRGKPLTVEGVLEDEPEHDPARAVKAYWATCGLKGLRRGVKKLIKLSSELFRAPKLGGGVMLGQLDAFAFSPGEQKVRLEAVDAILKALGTRGGSIALITVQRHGRRLVHAPWCWRWGRRARHRSGLSERRDFPKTRCVLFCPGFRCREQGVCCAVNPIGVSSDGSGSLLCRRQLERPKMAKLMVFKRETLHSGAELFIRDT